MKLRGPFQNALKRLLSEKSVGRLGDFENRRKAGTPSIPEAKKKKERERKHTHTHTLPTLPQSFVPHSTHKRTRTRFQVGSKHTIDHTQIH